MVPVHMCLQRFCGGVDGVATNAKQAHTSHPGALQVLFCTLAPAQRAVYKQYLASKDVAEILDGRRPSMEGITTLRKICNHADLLHRVQLAADPDVDYGALERSAKLQVTMTVRCQSAVLKGRTRRWRLCDGAAATKSGGFAWARCAEGEPQCHQ